MENEKLVQKVKDFVDATSVVSKMIIESGKELSPELYICFVDENDELHPMRTPGIEIFFRSNTTKDLLPGFIEKIFQALQDEASPVPDMMRKPVALVLISDIYKATSEIAGRTPEQAMREELPPSQRPDRTEALMFVCYFKEESLMRVYPYTREERGIVFAEMEEMAAAEGAGRFAKLFPS